MLEITSHQNSMIKEIASLKTKKGRWSRQSYIIEGFKIVREALKIEGLVQSLIFSDASFKTAEAEEIAELLNSKGSMVRLSDKLYSQLTGMENPQGILAVLAMRNRNIGNIKESGRWIYLDGLQDPGNCGTIIRSADAFSFDGIIFGKGCVDPYNPKVVQASMGSILRVGLYFSSNSEIELGYLINNGFRLISTSADGSDKLTNFDFSDRDIIVIGNEGSGVSSKILDLSSHRISIPMPGNAESLNAGVAASLIMYEAACKPRISVEF
jgi:TrmH family RNA methyltransferase